MRDPEIADVCHQGQLSELPERGWAQVSWARIVWLDPTSAPTARALLDRWVCRESSGSSSMWLHNQRYLVEAPEVTGRTCVKVADIRKAIPAAETPPFLRRS
ncbi:MAG: hypothetical protein EOO73_05485 [Myxococcales bacterium]|nr:MAG: hypothetical protein EOO73_05485 [Myxococcales bacterium]